MNAARLSNKRQMSTNSLFGESDLFLMTTLWSICKSLEKKWTKNLYVMIRCNQLDISLKVFLFVLSLPIPHFALNVTSKQAAKNRQNHELRSLTLHLFIYLFIYRPQEIAFPKMVASCCRFLCYFCRISRQNQKAMFDHLSYLLENSSVGLGKFW